MLIISSVMNIQSLELSDEQMLLSFTIWLVINALKKKWKKSKNYFETTYTHKLQVNFINYYK